MLKGVNKNIIEISETGNPYFNKAILFIAPQYVQNGKRVKREVADFISCISLNDNTVTVRAIMKRRKKRRKMFIGILSCVLCFLVGAIILL